MQAWLLVMIGGAIGAALRYGVSLLTARTTLDPGFPWATLAVNLIGGLAAGFVLGAILARGGGGEIARPFLLFGLLGGFTTFSAFSAETAFLIFEGRFAMALVYVLASVIGAILLTFAGLWLSGAGS